MLVRDLKYGEINKCAMLVLSNWGPDAADRSVMQMLKYFEGGDYAPHFYVAENLGIIGFSAFCPSMKMRDSYDLIWIAVHRDYQGKGVGRALTQVRLDEIKRRGGSLVSLVTQKPKFFEGFGFKKVDDLDEWCLMTRKLSPVRI